MTGPKDSKAPPLPITLQGVWLHGLPGGVSRSRHRRRTALGYRRRTGIAGDRERTERRGFYRYRSPDRTWRASRIPLAPSRELYRHRLGTLPPETTNGTLTVADLITLIRERNPKIPIFLNTEKLAISAIPLSVISRIDGYIWKLEDTPPGFIAGHIKRAATNYLADVLPPFFRGG
ncbi:hypothetical protein [Methanoculleus chikugoensis]|uniref:Orn/Lys/Arg decarboxylase N-terminal domain-containing protein n=1 Tax=Methanoculleus chikugoensis TaxID=118126 RepID=UPI001FB301D9|nr:Orn/Lys/Arg decarboxylase N-terminal domain-containing protein [Methanoculleus chikugoensis]